MSASAATRDRRRGRRGVAVGVGAALVAGGVVAAVDLAGAPPAAAAALTPFASCDELVGWYSDAALEQVTAWGLGGGTGGGFAVAEAAGAAVRATAPSPAADAATAGAVGSSGTGTNVQEEGVDEPSRVKLVDGVAFTLLEERLVLVDVAAGRVLGDVAVGSGAADGWASELLVLGDRVVVLGSASLPAPGGTDAPGTSGDLRVDPGLLPAWGAQTTTLTTVDVSDPSAPTVVDRAEVEGGYVSARASAGVVRVVTTASPVLPFVDPWRLQQDPGPGAAGAPDAAVAEAADLGAMVEPDPAAEQAALERNQQIVRDATAADWLPDVVERDADGTVTSTRPVACDTVAHPGEGAGTGTLTVLTLDPTATEPLLGTTSVSADGSLVYASTDRLYVATTRGGWLWGAAQDGRTTTELHGFGTATAATDYLGSGSVDGWLLGSWAMDAHEGYLRVGTTVESPAVVGGAVGGAVDGAGGVASGVASTPATTGSSSSSVVVLQETADGLVETGRADGLGPGEQIRSLRWFDDLAVVVTFRQTDPLYTVDLADPAAPRVLGELKVTGYSGYLHPVGDGMLLGVGQAGDESGTLSGAKVETYDLRDLALPRAVDELVWPGASSGVEWDSRLFAYLPARRVAVLTLDQSSPDGMYTSGLVAVGVDEAGGATEVGRWAGEPGGSTGAVATDGDVVVAQREVWVFTGDAATEGPRHTLVVLGAADLAPRAEVDLG